MYVLVLFVLAGVAGAAFSLQGPINAGLSRYAGGALGASFVTFMVAAVTMTVVYVAAVAAGHGGTIPPAGAPRHLYLSGCLGVLGIVLMTVTVPRIGVTAAVAAMIAGQLLAALGSDRFGWFGGVATELAPRQWLGAVLMLLAVWLVRR
jgi:transporter family-2 protein